MDFGSAKSLFEDLNDTLANVRTLYEFRRGSGLSAPQIGILLRAVVIHYNEERKILVNPEIVYVSGEKVAMKEGCLSFFEFRGNVERHTEITVKALDENGTEIEIKGSGDLASLLQHEIDHLDGILYFDRMQDGEKGLYGVDGMPTIP